MRLLVAGVGKRIPRCPKCGDTMTEEPKGIHLGRGVWLLAYTCKCDRKKGELNG